MILGPISGLDCIVFLLLLAPQLILHAGFLPTLICGLQGLPFLLVSLPFNLLYHRLFLRIVYRNRNSSAQPASWFEDAAIQCMRYGFARIPPKIARVFFSKQVALPLLRFRMLRHGYIRSPIQWRQVKQDTFQGLWTAGDHAEDPDIVLYYVHGGGFAMGSSYFYLEVLQIWFSLLTSAGFKNPAIFVLDYSLVPDESYPVQLHQVLAGYYYVCSRVRNPADICIAGDSAGATLVLSLLLHLGQNKYETMSNGSIPNKNNFKVPGMAILISPWVKLLSTRYRDTSRDYLNATSLQLYAHQYCNNKISLHDPRISPGHCRDASWWHNATPSKGLFLSYGSEEVFAPEIKDLVLFWKQSGIAVECCEEKDGIHAWPIARTFLNRTRKGRQEGIRNLVSAIRNHMCSK